MSPSERNECIELYRAVHVLLVERLKGEIKIGTWNRLIDVHDALSDDDR